MPQDLYERFMELVNGQPVRPAWVDVAMGRQLEMPRTGGCATLFTFDELCNRPLGAGGAGRVGKGSGRFVWGGKGVGGLGGGSADRQAGRQAEQAAHLTPIGCPPPIDPGPPLFPSSLFFLLLPPSAHLHRVSPPTCVPCPCAIHPPHPHVSLIPAPAADYIALANAKHTVALSGVPVFTAANRQTAYRFVTLVDVLYEHRWGSGGVGGGVFVCFRSRARERDREGEIERERERSFLAACGPQPAPLCPSTTSLSSCRVRFLCSAEAMPFELFENVKTQQEARAGGREHGSAAGWGGGGRSNAGRGQGGQTCRELEQGGSRRRELCALSAPRAPARQHAAPATGLPFPLLPRVFWCVLQPLPLPPRWWMTTSGLPRTEPSAA